MKFIHLLTLLCLTIIFAGCASTDDSAAIEDSNTDAALKTTNPTIDDQEGLLMDRYKSGAIEGYRE